MPSISAMTKLHTALHVVVEDQTFIVPLEGGLYRIGRSNQCAIYIPGRYVSRHQAVLIRDPQGRYTINDGDGFGSPSSNGTFVNDVQVQHRLLEPGDVIQFGSPHVTAYFVQSEAEDFSTSAAGRQVDRAQAENEDRPTELPLQAPGSAKLEPNP